jgi:O-antigen/teichoic acid export membrane protein
MSTEPRTPRRSGSLLSGAGVLVAGRYVVAALGWIGTVIIANQLTTGDFGRFSTIVSILAIVGFVADLKLSRIVLRDVLDADEDESGRVVGSYIGLRLVIGLVSYVIAMAWLVLFGYEREIVEGGAVMGLNLIILSAAFGLILLFEARLWLRDVAVANVLGQIVQFAMTVSVAVLSVASILWFSWATVANSVILIGWLVFATRHATRVRLGVHPGQWWHWLKEAAPLALGAALDTIYFRIDVVMLGLLDTFTAVGIYSAGYKFSDLIGSVPLAIVTPALTMMVAAWPNDVPAFRRTFRHTFVILTVGAVGACVGFVIFAEPLISLVFNDQKYAAATEPAQLLVIGQGLHFFTLLAFTTLVAAGRNRLYPIAMLVGVVVNVALNFLLIPEFSAVGSGWATIVTEVLVLALLGFGVARIPGIRPFPWVAVAKCFGAGAGAAAVGLVSLHRIPWPVAGGLCALTYVAIVHFARVDGPGGLRALAGEPRDDLAAVVEEGLDRPEIGGSL